MTSLEGSWYRRIVAGAVLIASVTAGVAAFLANLGNIRGYFSDEYLAADLMLRNVTINEKGGREIFLQGADAPDGENIHAIVSFVAEKKDTGQGRNCKGELIFWNGSIQSSYVADDAEGDWSENKGDTFEIKNSDKSIMVFLTFSVELYYNSKEGSDAEFRVVCDGIITHGTKVRTTFYPMIGGWG